MKKKITTIEEAQIHLSIAYESLQREGLSEKFFPLAVDVGQKHWGKFFGEFGSDSGVLLEIRKSFPSEIVLTITINRYKPRFWRRIREAIAESWNIFRGRESSFTLHIADEQLANFKNLLRQLQ